MTTFYDMMRTLDGMGFMDVVLPFMLVFTIVYAILTTVVIGASDATDKKNTKFALIIGLVIAFGVVIPHVTGTYPPGTDVVDIINNSLPIVALIAVGIIGLFIILGMFGIELNFMAGSLVPIIVVLALGLIVFIFGSNAGWGWKVPKFLSFLTDKDTISFLIVVAVFGLIVKFITAGDNTGEKKGMEKFQDSMKNVHELFFGPRT